MMDEKHGAHPEEALSAYLDGELEPAERAAIEEHLRTCSACADLLEDLRHLDAAATTEVPPPVPAGLAGRISDRLSPPRVVEMPRRRRALKSWLGPIPLAAAATLATVAVLATVQLIGPGEVGRLAPQTAPEEDLQGPVAAGGAVQEEALRPVSDKRDTLKVGRAADEAAPGAAGSEREEETQERLAELRSLGYVADGPQSLAPPPDAAERPAGEGKAAGVTEVAAPPAGKKGKPAPPASPVAGDEDRARAPAGRLRAMASEPPRPGAAAETDVPEEGRMLRTGAADRRTIVLEAPGYRIGISEDGGLTLRSAEYLCAVPAEPPPGPAARGVLGGALPAQPVAEKAKSLPAEIEDLFRLAALLREASRAAGLQDYHAAARDAAGASWVVTIADPGEPLLRLDASAGRDLLGDASLRDWGANVSATQEAALQDESTRRHLAAWLAERIRTLARRDYAALLESRCGSLPEPLRAPE